MVRNTDRHFRNEEIRECVLTVPAYFSPSQRELTKKSMLYASIDCIRIVEEPIAASLHEGLRGIHQFSSKKVIYWLIFDFGGGTLDTTILKIRDYNLETLEIAGDNELGGLDIDDLIVKFILQQINEELD